MKNSSRFLATFMCSVVLSVPACGTLEKSGANQSSQLPEVHQGRLAVAEPKVSAISIEPSSWGSEGNHPVAQPKLVVKRHLPYWECQRIPTYIHCFMPCCV
jgi:hypothetical protein